MLLCSEKGRQYVALQHSLVFFRMPGVTSQKTLFFTALSGAGIDGVWGNSSTDPFLIWTVLENNSEKRKKRSCVICISLLPLPPHSATAPSGPGSPHYRGFAIKFRHITVGGTPLDERSARSRGLYLTTHSTHNRHTSMPPARFEPTIAAGEGPQTVRSLGLVT